MLITAQPSAADAACPDCGLTSTRIHSRYECTYWSCRRTAVLCTGAFSFAGSDAATPCARDRISADHWPKKSRPEESGVHPA
jgi:hypothetical protein